MSVGEDVSIGSIVLVLIVLDQDGDLLMFILIGSSDFNIGLVIGIIIMSQVFKLILLVIM